MDYTKDKGTHLGLPVRGSVPKLGSRTLRTLSSH